MTFTASTQSLIYRTQLGMASIYWSLGGWCLVHPSSVLSWTLPMFPQSIPTQFILRCFGAQACLVGTLWSSATFTRSRPFYIWAAAMLPFIVFDVWAWQSGYLTTIGFLLDLMPNLVQLGASVYTGWRIDNEPKSKKK